MTRYQVTTEDIVTGTPEQCWDAIIAEAEGLADWWGPMISEHRIGDVPAGNVGAVISVRANPGGHADRRWGTAAWRMRTVDVEPCRRIAYEMTEGDFSGTGVWTLAPLGTDRTRITVEWRADPVGVTKVWALFVDPVKGHVAAMHDGMRKLEAYLAQRAVA